MSEPTRFARDWCHVGGQHGGHPNYGWPHVTGWVSVTMGHCRNCIFCGKDLSSECVEE